METLTTETNGIDAACDELNGPATSRDENKNEDDVDELVRDVISRDEDTSGQGSQVARTRSKSNKERRPYVKEDPDRLYLESDGVVYEIEEAQGTITQVFIRV